MRVITWGGNACRRFAEEETLLKRRLALAVALAACAVMVGCGKAQPTEPASFHQNVAPGAAVDSTTAGAITGSAFLEGALPASQSIDMSSEPACAKANSSPSHLSEVVTGESGALANVVVFVKSGLENYRFDTPKEAAVLDQRGCTYEPRIVALMANQPLEIRNDDATIHNIHATPKSNSEWNKAQRAGSPPLQVSFPTPELAIPFMCNVHPWMRAFVFVFANPYYAVTAREGKFGLRNLPPGTYTIEAWHEKYGRRDQTVTIGARESKTISFRFQ